MYSFRITKYNPIYRDEFGAFIRDEWTAISDVGNIYNGKTFDINEYLRVEEMYISAIIKMIDCLGITGLMVSKIVRYEDTLNITKDHEIYTNEMKQLYQDISDNQIVTGRNLKDLCKLRLRELIGFRLTWRT